MNASKNTLYYGDNLQIMQNMPAKFVDLVYLDPPFKSNQNYNKAKRGRKSSPAQVVQTTEDKWLDKFPAFDPSWDKEFRKTWMEAFLTLHPSVAGRTGGDVATGNDDSVDEDDEQEQ